jgi:nicotinamide phosphoribosyltransferase
MKNKNLILKTDAYKGSQAFQYCENAEKLFSYIESRGGIYPETVFFGLQYYLKEFLSGTVTVEDVEEAKEVFAAMGVDFNYDGWMYIATQLKGKLPLRIRAVPEGLRIPNSNILMSLESTDPKVFWVVNWMETLLLKVWYSSTVATQSYYLRQLIYKSLVETADDPDAEIPYKLLSFGARGSSTEETAALGGAAELTSFAGTDTIVGLLCARDYYNADIKTGIGVSANASEHSTICSWGQEHELDAYRNMIKLFGKPGKLFACVSDSFNIYKACEMWGTELKEEVINSGATLVVRLDSGDPHEVIPKCLNILADKFGTMINTKGYKVLNNVRILQGDGVNPTSIAQLLELVKGLGFSISNITFGMGGASLQGSTMNTMNRDTQKFAFKASSIMVDGKEHPVFKDPITDSGKRSKRGLLDLVCRDGKYKTVNEFQTDTVMKTVWENGELLIEEDFKTIQSRIYG